MSAAAAPEFFRHIDGQMVMQFNASKQVVRRNYWGPGDNQLLGYAARANEDSSWESFFVGQDEQMSVREVVDGSGGRDWHMHYSDFGVASAVKMDAGVPDDRLPVFGYTGEYRDGTAGVTTGLMNYGARWYSPELGRFISPDPAGFAAGDGNLYRYVGNEPINRVDPTGMFAVKALNRAASEPTGVGAGKGEWRGPGVSPQQFLDAQGNRGLATASIPRMSLQQLEALERVERDRGTSPAINFAGILAAERMRRSALASEQAGATRAAYAGAYVQGAYEGSLIGFTANVNAAADTVFSTVTLGQYELGGVIPVAGWMESGYQASYASARVASEVFVGVGTAGLSGISNGGKAIRLAGSIARGYDATGGVLGISQGVISDQKDGLNWSNGIQIAAGGAGIGGNLVRPGPYGGLPNHHSAASGKDFTKAQKQKILDVNAKTNGGVIRDDVTGEELVRRQKHVKGVRPPENEAHIDHVDPKSKGGTNGFENANVRSRANNLAKGNR